jgi:hypothetical protein
MTLIKYEVGYWIVIGVYVFEKVVWLCMNDVVVNLLRFIAMCVVCDVYVVS